MRNLYIGSLQVHDSQAALDYWLETPLEGLDMPAVRLNVYDKPGEDGAVVSSAFYGGRPLILRGKVKGNGPSAFETNRIALTAACAQQKDSNGYPITTRITFTTLAGITYFVDVNFQKVLMNYDNINSANFLIEAIVPNPYIFGNIANATTIARAIGGGMVLPFILPVILAASSGGSANVVNSGSATAFPVLVLTGPLTNPYINNATVGKSMQLNYTIDSVSVVRIDMLNKTIMLNGSTSILSVKTVDSEWWGLTPGTNAISFNTSSSADTGNLEIDYYSAYLGV